MAKDRNVIAIGRRFSDGLADELGDGLIVHRRELAQASLLLAGDAHFDLVLERLGQGRPPPSSLHHQSLSAATISAASTSACGVSVVADDGSVVSSADASSIR